MVLNLAPINMKKTRITITHQLEKTKHHFLVVNPDKLTSIEVDRVKKRMGVEMMLVNGRLYNSLFKFTDDFHKFLFILYLFNIVS
jgi:hypothetical protein